MIWAKLHVIYLNNKNGGILLPETTLIVKKIIFNKLEVQFISNN